MLDLTLVVLHIDVGQLSVIVLNPTVPYCTSRWYKFNCTKPYRAVPHIEVVLVSIIVPNPTVPYCTSRWYKFNCTKFYHVGTAPRSGTRKCKPNPTVHQGSISKQNRTKPYSAVLQIKVLQVSLTVHCTKPYRAVF